MTRKALDRDALVLCAGTIPRASFSERVAAARAAGFAGISLRVGDCRRARERFGEREVRAMLAGEGVAVAEVEAVTAWRAPVTDAGAEAVRETLALAEAVGARSVSVVEGPGDAPAVDAAAAEFAALCDRAADHGLLVHIEFWPGSALDLPAAVSIVDRAGRPNGGLLVDTWHLARTPDGLDALSTLPGERVVAVQISDSPPVDGPEPEYLRAAMHDRLLPGEGALDLAGVVRRLDALGAAAPLGTEIWSDRLAELPAIDAARLAGDALRALVRAARADH